MILEFLAIYALIGVLVFFTMFMIHGDRLFKSFNVIADRDMDIGPIGIMVAVTFVCIIAWPTLLRDM